MSHYLSQIGSAMPGHHTSGTRIDITTVENGYMVHITPTIPIPKNLPGSEAPLGYVPDEQARREWDDYMEASRPKTHIAETIEQVTAIIEKALGKGA